MDDDDFDKEVKELVQWSENLDYDEYVRSWFQLSTSNASENFIQSHQFKIWIKYYTIKKISISWFFLLNGVHLVDLEYKIAQQGNPQTDLTVRCAFPIIHY